MNFVGCLPRDWHARIPAADGLAIAAVISLPWSTSLTSILVGLWLFAVVPQIRVTALFHSLFSLPGGLPALLVALAVLGMLWSDVSLIEQWSGLRVFLKLLVIPVLLVQFRISKNGNLAVLCFLISCSALLVLSILSAIWPSLTWWRPGNPGVPFKNQTTQSAEFTVCAFCLMPLALKSYLQNKYLRGIGLAALSAAFLGSVFFIATSRTELLVIATLIVAVFTRTSGWKGFLPSLATIAVLAPVILYSSSYLQARLRHGDWEIEHYITEHRPTSIGMRLDWWRQSLDIWKAAPIIGHGTGSIQSSFRKNVAQLEVNSSQFVTTDPHNQLIAVALQLGLVGVIVLLIMWVVHFRLFNGSEIVAWFGMVVVAQNIVASMFNSHLANFTEGWLYVFAVGILGGMMQRPRCPSVMAAFPGPSTAAPSHPRHRPHRALSSSM